MKTIFPWKFNLEYDGTFTKLFVHVSSRNMFPTTRNLQIRVHVYRPRHYGGDWLTFGCFVPMIADHNLVKKGFGPMIADHDLVNKRLTIMDAEVSTHTFLTMIIEESVCFMSCEPFFSQIILMWYIRNTYIYFFINWTLCMSDNLPERVQILCRAYIICITVLEHRIIWCQLFCDLLLKSAFERIFNVMQLLLVKIKWHIKWNYLIQTFHDICLSNYSKTTINRLL
jgi:hypothetical protein